MEHLHNFEEQVKSVRRSHGGADEFDRGSRIGYRKRVAPRMSRDARKMGRKGKSTNSPAKVIHSIRVFSQIVMLRFTIILKQFSEDHQLPGNFSISTTCTHPRRVKRQASNLSSDASLFRLNLLSVSSLLPPVDLCITAAEVCSNDHLQIHAESGSAVLRTTKAQNRCVCSVDWSYRICTPRRRTIDWS